MWILSFLMIFAAIAGSYAGYQPFIKFERLNKNNLLNGSLIIFSLFTLLIVLYNFGYFPQSVAAPFMTGVYSFLAGFFIGYATRLFHIRRGSGNVLYQYRSFWVDHAPTLLGIGLIIYGIFRTSLFTELPVTGIRLSSGISLMSFGFFTWTIKPIPEFRSKGILFLDKLIKWENVISWGWESEEVVTVDYITEQKISEERLREFQTFVPVEDKKELEMVLKSKMDEYYDIRKKKLLKED